MTAANVNVSAVNPALHRSPKALDAGAFRRDILFMRVIDRFVIKAFGCKAARHL